MDTQLDTVSRTAGYGRGGRLSRRRALAFGLLVGVLGLISFYGSRSGAPPSAERAAEGAAMEAQALRERLGITVAPNNPAQIEALAQEQAALREGFSLMVAPVDLAEIAELIRDRAALRAWLGIKAAPVSPAQIEELKRRSP
jgi:hypothetical protein